MVSAFLYKMMLLFAVLLDVAGAGAYSILQRSFISHHREIRFLISNAQVIFLVKKTVFQLMARETHLMITSPFLALDPGRLRVTFAVCLKGRIHGEHFPDLPISVHYFLSLIQFYFTFLFSFGSLYLSYIKHLTSFLQDFFFYYYNTFFIIILISV